MFSGERERFNKCVNIVVEGNGEGVTFDVCLCDKFEVNKLFRNMTAHVKSIRFAQKHFNEMDLILRQAGKVL